MDVDALSKLLRESGLDDDEIEQAIRIATGEESEEDTMHAAVRKGLEKSGLNEDAQQEIIDRVLANRSKLTSDRMPANALKQGSISSGGLGGYGHGHKNGEHSMAHDSFDELFGTARLRSTGRDGNFGYGGSDSLNARQLRHRPQRKMAYGDNDGDNDFYSRFPGAARLQPDAWRR